MARILIIGNAGGGKSVLARKLAAKRGVPYYEVDTIVWKPGWEAYPQAEYEAAHARLIAEENWVLDGLGWTETLPERFARATEIVLIDYTLSYTTLFRSKELCRNRTSVFDTVL